MQFTHPDDADTYRDFPTGAEIEAFHAKTEKVRKPISTRTRFEIFKRDKFTCQYCGAHPPGVLLHIDHVVAVATGGTNDASNLVTACQPCNLGKAAVPLGQVRPSIKEQAEAAKEMERQLRGYQRALEAVKVRLNVEVDRVEETFQIFFPDQEFSARFRISTRVFIEKLGVDKVVWAMEVAGGKMHGTHNAIKYFCGICWKTIRDAER